MAHSLACRRLQVRAFGYNSFMRSTRDILVLTAALASSAALACRLYVADAQVDWDEEVYFQVARAWAAGGQPYLNVFDHKPPGVYVLYALLSGFGHSMWTVRALVAVALLVTAHLAARSIHQALDRQADASVVTTSAFLLLLSRGAAVGANSEMLYIPLLLLTLYFALRGSNLGAGASSALALYVKYTTLLDLLGICAFVLALDGEQANGRRVKSTWLVYGAIGASVGYGLTYWFLLYQGVDLWHEIIVRNLAHGATRLPLLADNGFATSMRKLVPAYCIAAFIARRHGTSWMTLGSLALWFSLSAAQGTLTGLYYEHYFFPTILPVAAAMALIPMGQTDATRRWAQVSTPLYVAVLLYWTVSVSRGAQWTSASDDEQRALFTSRCSEIRDGYYVLDSYLAAYRTCGRTRPVDRYVFPPFYVDPHFARVAGSGGLEELNRRLRGGEIPGVVMRQQSPFQDAAKHLPDANVAYAERDPQ